MSATLDRNETVRTTRWRPASDLDDIGAYREIHWQTQAPRNVCLHQSNRQQFGYQLVIRLNPFTAEHLAKSMRLVSANMRQQDPRSTVYGYGHPVIWPALTKWVPNPYAPWMTATEYNDSFHTTRHREIWLDLTNAIAVVEFPGGDD